MRLYVSVKLAGILQHAIGRRTMKTNRVDNKEE